MLSAIRTVSSVLALGLLLSTVAEARVAAGLASLTADETTVEVAQRGCMSLSQAVDSIRRRGNVERVISAETRGNTHYIKVLTKDGKVRTHQVPAC